MPARAPIAGTRTASSASRTGTSTSASRSALWNGRDPILKERLFGLTNSEGNHGEDVKECYFYLDNVPTHSYMKALYKYPQAPFPYSELVDENRRRGRSQPEYELLDTGVFAEDRYWDVLVEYAKASPEDMLVQITVTNRGPDEATLDLLPDRSGSATAGRGTTTRPGRSCARAARAAGSRSSSRTRPAPDALPLLPARRRAAVHGKREQLRRDSGTRRIRRPS